MVWYYFGLIKTIVQDIELHYIDENTYDKYYNFTIDSCVLCAATLQANEKNILPSGLVQITECDAQLKEHDYNLLHPIFGWSPDDIIKKTFMNTKKYSRMPMIALIKNHYKSP